MSLLPLALLVLAVWLIRRALRGPAGRKAAEAGMGELVRCAHCGMHLPHAEARGSDEQFLYCSDEHARLGPSDRGPGGD